MSVRLNRKLIDQAPNVVRLPTAAPRQVDNYRYSAQRKAMRSKRIAEPWPGDHMFPGQRDAMRLARELQSIRQTPELLLVSAILASVDAATSNKIIEHLAPAIVGGSTPAKQALATARASRLNVGQQIDLFNAFDRIKEEGC